MKKATPRKRVLVVCQHFWPENFRLNDICDFLVEKDCDIEVLCGIPNYPTGKFFPGYGFFKNRKQVHNGIDIRRSFEIPRGNNTNARIFINYVSFPLSSLFHVPRLLTKKYDKILIYQLSPVLMAIAGIIVGKLKKTETTLYVLDMWPENLFSVLNIQNKFLRSLVTKVSHWHYRKVDKLMVLTNAMQTKLQDVTQKQPGKIAVIPQTSEKIYEKEIEDKKLSQRFKQGFNIVFAGNISPAQSFETVVEAAEILKADGISDINWIIVGDGMSRKWLENEVEEKGLADSFTFEGQKPIGDVPRYTTIADALIGCLSKSDLLEATIPAKVMSYIAAGKPLILAMDGEVQELINNTIKCGYASETGNAKLLAKNIKRLYKLSPSERKKMGTRGKDYHFKHFERNLILNKLYSFLFA
jgi:glycosyltransferase involved in cell wall biosynthesis